MNVIINKLFDFVSEYSYGALMSLQDWPTDEEGDLLSTENISIEEIREDEVDILVGGDWQDPKYITLHLDDDLELKVKCHSWQPSDNEVYTYWFVSYTHPGGNGRCFFKVEGNIFNVVDAENTISNKNNFTSCITFYKQIPKEEYLS